MNARRARLLNQLYDSALYVLLGLQHQIAELVEHYYNLGQFFLSLFKVAVIFVDVLGGNLYVPFGVFARFGHLFEQRVPALHLLYCPVERLYRLIHVVDNLVNHQVRELVVAYELHLFGVNENEAQLFGAVFIQQADKERA